MIAIRNTNSRFGDEGPFAVESADALAREMQPMFRIWAAEAWDALAPEDRDENREVWIGAKVAAKTANFLAGLEVVKVNGVHRLTPVVFPR
jgi:hypothetical protein